MLKYFDNLSFRFIRVKRKCALLLKRHILLVLLLSVLTIVILYIQCLQHPETCIASFLKSKYHHLTKRSRKQGNVITITFDNFGVSGGIYMRRVPELAHLTELISISGLHYWLEVPAFLNGLPRLAESLRLIVFNIFSGNPGSHYLRTSLVL